MRFLASLLAVMTCQPACGGDGASPGLPDATPRADAAPPADADASDIFSRLSAIDGLTVEELPALPAGYRLFSMTYQQPVDQAEPAGPTFPQAIVLLHRDTTAPVVFHTEGYFVEREGYRLELTRLLAANQLAVEHRFFEPSRPAPADWSLLTIEQAAADHHRIVEAFRPIYGEAWVSTGASKGGMTAVYHRRFYPDDVDATVAYVAPITFGAPDTDPAYAAFFDSVGTAACRQALHDWQRDALLRRATLQSQAVQAAADQGFTFDVLGPDAAYEGVVVELEWGFWQYAGTSDCDAVPPAGAPDADMLAFLDGFSPMWFASDWFVLGYQPYYWQAATQLGYPTLPDDHIADLEQFPIDDISDFLPAGETAVFDPAPMLDVASWVASEGTALLFVYGDSDPWGVGAFDLGAATDSFSFVAPGANHGASISDLTAADRAQALAALQAWTGVTPQPAPAPRDRRRPEPLHLRARFAAH